MKFANQIKMNIHLHNPYWEGRLSSRGPLIVHSLGCYSNYLRQDRSHELLVFSGITSLWLLVSHMFAKINKVCVTTTKPRPGWLVVSIQHQLLAVILCHTFTGFNHTSQGTIHDHLISDGSQISRDGGGINYCECTYQHSSFSSNVVNFKGNIPWKKNRGTWICFTNQVVPFVARCQNASMISCMSFSKRF